MKNVIEVLEAKIEGAKKDKERAMEYIRVIDETGTTIHGSKDHYERSVLSAESYITGLQISINEIKKELA